MPNRTTLIRARRGAAVVLAAAALGACGGDGDGARSSGGRAAGDAEKAQLAFARCMREQGIDYPDPQRTADGNYVFQPPADGTDPAAVRRAEVACADELEKAGGGPPQGDRDALRDQALEFARCMREKGVDVPDPASGSGGIDADSVDLDDPAFQRAAQACQSAAGGSR